MIALGLILLIIGFLAHIAILWTIGIILLVVGAVLFLLGTMGRVRTQQGPTSDSVRLELQADCYAGMWTRDASDGDGILADLDQGDITEALDSAKAVGDDRIQQKSGQGVDPEGWTHGSSEQRMAWFTRGFEEGSHSKPGHYVIEKAFVEK